MGLKDMFDRVTNRITQDQWKTINYSNDEVMLQDLGVKADNIRRAAAYGPEAIDDALAAFNTAADHASKNVSHRQVNGAINNYRRNVQNMAQDAKVSTWIPDPRTGYTTYTPDPGGPYAHSQHTATTGLDALMTQMNKHLRACLMW
ncbi:hypothetical protein [Amycolatopsis sp. CA-126428]|uniref:hypothetical protein n=1 Tax=Amycolatopsis sp. CA-126428 TaxID=2073158 RepID=UPI0011B04F21|nr:hypothetical protein [Amycolatopsis sp. CA-126428]